VFHFYFFKKKLKSLKCIEQWVKSKQDPSRSQIARCEKRVRTVVREMRRLNLYKFTLSEENGDEDCLSLVNHALREIFYKQGIKLSSLFVRLLKG